jgi:enterochelin esterase family protein
MSPTLLPRLLSVRPAAALTLVGALALSLSAQPAAPAAPAQPAAPAAAATPAQPAAPAVAAPGQPEAQAAAPGAPGARGGRGGGAGRGGGGGARGGGRGGAMSAEDQAKLATLPAWKPGVGEGDYAMVPNSNNTPPFSDTNPAYLPAPENAPQANVPKGRVEFFLLPLAGSKFYPPGGGRGGAAAPAAGATAPATAASVTSPAKPDGTPYSREELHQKQGMGNNAVERNVYVYIPAGYVPGTPAPLLFCHDSMGMHDNLPAPFLPDILDNLIAAKRLPPMIAVMVDPSNQRSLEYDTVSGKYAEYVEAEILPLVEQKYNVKFTKDPEGRAVLGGSSGAAAAMSMAWFHTELWHRVLMFSPTFITFQTDPVIAPRGAVEFYANFIPNSPVKPLRIWFEVGQNDNSGWLPASMRTAEVLKAKGYHYQFVYAPQAGHTDRPVRSQTLAPALEWLWQDYKPTGK